MLGLGFRKVSVLHSRASGSGAGLEFMWALRCRFSALGLRFLWLMAGVEEIR